MFSKRELEGYVLIDHTESPGLTKDEAIAGGRDGIFPFVGAGKKLETATLTCGHWPCGRVFIANPERQRNRGYCPKCDHYVCDQCEAQRIQSGVCVPFMKGAENYLNAIRKSSLVCTAI